MHPALPARSRTQSRPRPQSDARRLSRSVRVTGALTALAGALALTGCQVAEGERPVATPSVSDEDVTSVPTPSDLDFVPVIDVSPGGPQATDAVWQGLAEAAESGAPAYVHAWIHTYQDVAEEGPVSLTPDTPDSVTLTVDDAAAVTAGQQDFYLIDATAEVEQLGDSAFSLTVVDTETRSQLLPKGPDDEARCTAADGNERIQVASQVMADTIRDKDTAGREQLRLQWGASPAVWWGIQRTALTLVDTDGDSAGDFLFEACAPFLEEGGGSESDDSEGDDAADGGDDAAEADQTGETDSGLADGTDPDAEADQG